MLEIKSAPAPVAPMQAVSAFMRSLGKTPMTAWRWDRRGWFHTINIAGRRYITSAEIARFMQRAEAGEFERTSHFTTAVKEQAVVK